MFITHIDEMGEDSPPMLIENTTAANRAVNVPEFVKFRRTVGNALYPDQYENHTFINFQEG